MTEVSNMLYDFMFNIKHTLIFSEIQGCIFDPGENTVNFHMDKELHSKTISRTYWAREWDFQVKW